MVRQLLSPRNATPAVVGFIKATRAAQKAQKYEEEIRKRKRDKDETWDLDANRLEGDEQVGEGEGEKEGSERGREG